MKYINFKRIKFSTIFNKINFTRYNFYKIYKNLHFRKYLDFKFSKYLNFKKYLNLRRYSYTKIIRFINFNKIKKTSLYLIGVTIFSFIIYLSAPAFYKYEKSQFTKVVCKDLNIKCIIKGKIKYSFYPSPRIKIKNLIIEDFTNKNKSIAKAENVVIKISVLNLIDKKKFNYTKVDFKNIKVNFDFKNLDKFKKISKNNFNHIPFNFYNGEINFLENNKYISKIENVNFNYRKSKNKFETKLKGKFLNDNIFINYEKEKKEKEFLNTITIKLSDLNLFSKIEIFNSFLENKINGKVLLKKNRNKLTGIFNYHDNEITFKHANLNSVFLDGKFSGNLKFNPYFTFDLDLNLNNINFNKVYNLLINLNEENKKNLFKINNKLNGKLSFSTNKIISKKSFIKSFESRLKFINGNIFIEQFLFNLGKLGAADLIGTINNDKKYSNLRFESNIFIDNLKKFYNKFGVYNKPKVPYDLYISGNLNLTNFVLNLNEISSKKKFSAEDINYFDKEFNEILLKEDYKTLFNYKKLKEFIKLTTVEEN